MNSNDLINSITKKIYEKSEQNIVYLSSSENLMKSCHEIASSETIEINLRNNYSPLAPFLNILAKQNISNEILRTSTYGLQYDTFQSFFKNGLPNERKDPIIVEEINYEKIRIRKTIINLLEKCFTGTAIIYNAQFISDDALKILEQLENSSIKGKFLFCFNTLEFDSMSTALKNFNQKIIKQDNYFTLNSFEDFSAENFNSQKADNNTDFSEIYKQLKSYRLFLDTEKAYSLAKEIDISDILVNANINEARLIYIEMGIISFYNGDTDFASFYFNNILESQIEDDVECYALYFLAQVSTRKNMNSVALKYISKAISKAKKYENSQIYALAVMEEYIITERKDSQYSTKKYFNALNLLDQAGLANNKIYTSLVIPYGIVYEKTLRDQMAVQVEKSKDDAEKIGNKFGLSIACHWMGIIMTHNGQKEKAHIWYKESFKLREEIGDFSSLIKVLNGLSYEYLVDTEYKESYDVINNVLNNLLESKDYPEIIITFFNLARTCFYSRNLNIAYSLIQTILNLLSIFTVSDLGINSFFPEYNDIIAYKAMLDFYNGEFTRAKMNLHNMMNNRKPFSPIEEFIKFFLAACINLEEGNKDEAINIFEKSLNNFFPTGITQEHRLVFMLYEFANFLEQKGFHKESEKYFCRGLKIAKEKNLINFTKGKDSITLQEYIDGVEKFAPLKINLEALEEKAEKERLLNQLHKKLRDSQFLNRLSTNHANDLKDNRFATNIALSVFDYTMADAVFLAEKKDNQWKLLAQSLRDNIENPTDDEWEKLSESKNFLELKKSTEKDRQTIYINLSKFEFTGGMIIFLQKNNQLNLEELNILNIAASNIQAQIVMLKQNEHLAKISATDQLSMLNNRRALHDHLNLESEMIRRYEKKRNMYMHDAISFLDLDNFKYYNDTFGHEAGDLLISSFAKLLKEIYRKVDFVARFGGDEFVIVLPNTNCKEAERAAERLYEGLAAKKHFIPELEKLLNKKLDIPENRKLGFSVGIAANSDEDDISDLDTTMTNADKALYYSKQHKKGTVTIWSEIKDKIDETNLIGKPKR